MLVVLFWVLSNILLTTIDLRLEQWIMFFSCMCSVIEVYWAAYVLFSLALLFNKVEIDLIAFFQKARIGFVLWREHRRHRHESHGHAE